MLPPLGGPSVSAANDAVAMLVELGLNRNEALAYVGLLEHAGPQGATGYELGTISGVPRSAIYKILHRLEQMGAVFPVGDNPVRYVPTDAKTFVVEMSRSFEGRATKAAASLSKLSVRERPEPVWTLSRYDDVMDRIESMIRGAEHSIYLSIWQRELDRLAGAFAAVADRDLHRVVHSPARLAGVPKGFVTWDADVAVDEPKAGWSHKALVVVDRVQALIGGTEPNADNHAVWTSNPSIVDTTTNHIVLDITLLAKAQGRDCSQDVSPMMRPHLERL